MKQFSISSLILFFTFQAMSISIPVNIKPDTNIYNSPTGDVFIVSGKAKYEVSTAGLSAIGNYDSDGFVAFSMWNELLPKTFHNIAKVYGNGWYMGIDGGNGDAGYLEFNRYSIGNVNFVQGGGNVGIGVAIPRISLDVSDRTDAIGNAKGTTAQRPGSPRRGYQRYNTDSDFMEYWNGKEWRQF